MRKIMFYLLAALLIGWTVFVGWTQFRDATAQTFGLSIMSFSFIWAWAGIPLSLLALVFKPR